MDFFFNHQQLTQSSTAGSLQELAVLSQLCWFVTQGGSVVPVIAVCYKHALLVCDTRRQCLSTAVKNSLFKDKTYLFILLCFLYFLGFFFYFGLLL